MTPRSFAATFLAAITTAAAPLAAQAPSSRTGHDSVEIATGTRVAARQSGASVAVIDSAELATTGARTLSELLLARVAGLSVSHRGGTELDGADVRARGLSSPLDFAPLLVVDGVLASGDQRVELPGTEVALSRLDDFTPADLERVEVLRGPAAAALYGVGAANGVIVLTTRRGAAGPLRVGATAGAGMVDLAARFPANYELTSGAPHAACDGLYVASCTPTTVYSWNPLQQASPFRTGVSTTGGANVSGALFGARLFAGAGAERVEGVTADDRQSRRQLRASVERALPGAFTLSASGGWVRRDGIAPSRGAESAFGENILARGLIGQAYDDSSHGFAPVGQFPGVTTRAQEAEPATVRTTAAVRLDWRPRSWLTVTSLGGRDRVRLDADRSLVSTGSGDPYTQSRRVADRWTSGTVHVGAEARWSLFSLGMSSLLAYDDVRARLDSRDSSASAQGQAHSYSLRTLEGRADRRDVTARQHVAWRALDLNAGARWSATHGISAPRGVDAARSVDLSYRLPTLPGGATARLRAAAGVSPLADPQGFQLYHEATLTTPGGGYGYDWYVLHTYHPRAGEREAGLDLTLGARTDVQLTYYRAQSRDVPLGTYSTPSAGFAELLAVGDVRSRGLEATASTRLIDRSRAVWDLTLTGATLSSRISANDRLATVLSTRAHAGDVVQGYWRRQVSWSDVDGDGIRRPGEFAYGAQSYIGPSLPTIEAGLHSAVTLGRRLTIAALLDYRGGHYRENGNERSRCATQLCQLVEDPATPADVRQIAAMSWSTDFAGTFVEPADYLRLREVVLEWQAPALARATRLDAVALRLVGQNLATWTRYSGIDPEVSTGAPAGVGTLPEELFESPLSRRFRLELRLGTSFTR